MAMAMPLTMAMAMAMAMAIVKGMALPDGPAVPDAGQGTQPGQALAIVVTQHSAVVPEPVERAVSRKIDRSNNKLGPLGAVWEGLAIRPPSEHCASRQRSVSLAPWRAPDARPHDGRRARRRLPRPERRPRR